MGEYSDSHAYRHIDYRLPLAVTELILFRSQKPYILRATNSGVQVWWGQGQGATYMWGLLRVAPITQEFNHLRYTLHLPSTTI